MHYWEENFSYRTNYFTDLWSMNAGILKGFSSLYIIIIIILCISRQTLKFNKLDWNRIRPKIYGRKLGSAVVLRLLWFDFGWEVTEKFWIIFKRWALVLKASILVGDPGYYWGNFSFTKPLGLLLERNSLIFVNVPEMWQY